jgi:hypothetical protein
MLAENRQAEACPTQGKKWGGHLFNAAPIEISLFC